MRELHVKSFEEQRKIDSLRFEEQRLAGELVALKRQILDKLWLPLGGVVEEDAAHPDQRV